MIKKVDCFTVVCDLCGKDAFEGDEINGWNDESFAESYAEDEDFKTDGDKHYCPDCYHYDDDDNLVIKSVETPQVEHIACPMCKGAQDAQVIDEIRIHQCVFCEYIIMANNGPHEWKLQEKIDTWEKAIDVEVKQFADITQKWAENNLDLRLTCSACPEQYEVYRNEVQVGYIRLRHGKFTVQTEVMGEIMYQAEPIGDGIFEPHEREHYLDEAMKAILLSLNENNKTETQ
jgi:predicted acetyltransferase